MDLNAMLVAYVMGGGEYPATFLLGYGHAGRYGVNGEGAGIPEAERKAYRAGGTKAQEDRAAPPATPWMA